MAPDVTGNEKKFKTLVADFVNTTADLGGTIDPEVVATELRQRIQAIPAHVGPFPRPLICLGDPE